MAASFSGGEVVPLLVIGSGPGATFASFTGLEVSGLASLGALAMLSGGTNLPLVCFTLDLELFGYSEPILLFLATVISFVASGKYGIYRTQINPY
ncbi:MAG: chloride channel protein [Spirochaetales bacterium]|nr:chloride channel protein [Spirochaetales bacterium]